MTGIRGIIRIDKQCKGEKGDGSGILYLALI